LSFEADPAGPGSSEESPAVRAEGIRGAPAAARIAEARPARRPRLAGRARRPVSHQLHGKGAEPGAEFLPGTRRGSRADGPGALPAQCGM